MRGDSNTTGGTSLQDRRDLQRRFQAQEVNVRLGNYRRGAFLAAVFILLGGVMDLVVYNGETGSAGGVHTLRNLFLLRAGCAVSLLGVLLLLYRVTGQRTLRLLGHVIALFPMVAIDLMLVETEGGSSPYYAGLNLVMVGAVLLLRWKFSDGVINAVLCIGGYLAVAFGTSTAAQDIAVALFFLGVTAVFACVGLFFYNRLRFAEFCLREEVIEQQAELAENHRKLKQLDETKTQFFANINHELRTPLTLILAPVEKLRAANPVRNDPELASLVDSLEDNGMRLLRLINDLLDLVRLDSGEMPVRPERFAPSIFLEGLGRNLLPMAERKRINLSWKATCGEDCQVYLDRDRLEKVILNLAVNALKFTPPSGRVKLEVGVDGQHLLLKVEDTGTGMAPDQVRQAFERFWQADTSARKSHRGVGIGLALVKSLTESMGGTVDIDSELGVGTTFAIRVPLMELPSDAGDLAGGLQPREERDPIEQIHEKARLHGALASMDAASSPLALPGVVSKRLPDGIAKREQVLIAEDDHGLRRYLRAEVEDLGVEVLEAADGEEAWKLACQFQPELIISDYMMPGRDGITLTRQLRDHPPTAQLPIILVTAAADETPRLEALKAGVSDFLTKPFTTAELRLRIRNLLDRQKYQRELGIKNQALAVALEEIKENEARLLQAEKLSSLGRMSAGIVHEVNNPLNYAKTALHTLRVYSDDLPETEREDFEETIHDAEDGVNRVIRIVSDLRSFTKGEVTMQEEITLAETIEMARRLLSGDLAGIAFEVDIPEDLKVGGNSNQLCQVFVNIIQNSAQALEGLQEAGGMPKVEVRARENRAGRIELTIRDNGPGIPEEDRKHIFEPFFTKREVGEGMGLGLSICHRILQSHRGDIEVDSVPGHYTEFKITLPRPWDGEEHEDYEDSPDDEELELQQAHVK